jgi:RHS repeat-associated protein
VKKLKPDPFCASPYQFNGGFGVETDASGLLYMRNRYYNPRLMRFVNADPIGFDGGNNWYAFCGNNPISFFDPLGLDRAKMMDPFYAYGKKWTALDEASYQRWIRGASGYASYQGPGAFVSAVTGAGSGLYYAGRGLVTAPYRLGQGVVSGYQQIGGFIGETIVDPGQFARDLLNMQLHPMDTLGSEADVVVGMAACVVAEINAKAQTTQGRGELWGDATFALLSAGAMGAPSTNVRLGVHGPHHSFGSFGKLSHVQLNWWTPGAKGSGGAVRMPLPWR